MDTETSEPCTNDWREVKCKVKEHMNCHGCGGAIYGLGFVGALVYYLTTATTLIADFGESSKRFSGLPSWFMGY